jgi:hypothetical protein
MIVMETMTDVEKDMVESVKNDQITLSNDFIPEKSAEEIIFEIRGSRSFGRTRIIESL